MKNQEEKSANLFYGTDTYGRAIEVAIRKDGIMFWRSYGYNGYGNGWKKWEQLKEKKEVIKDNNKEFIKWGWNELSGISANRRLPKAF